MGISWCGVLLIAIPQLVDLSGVPLPFLSGCDSDTGGLGALWGVWEQLPASYIVPVLGSPARRGTAPRW